MVRKKGSKSWKGKEKRQGSTSSAIAPVDVTPTSTVDVTPTSTVDVTPTSTVDVTPTSTVDVMPTEKIFHSLVIKQGFSKLDILIKKLRVGHDNLIAEYILLDEEAYKNIETYATSVEEIECMEEALSEMRKPHGSKLWEGLKIIEERLEEKVRQGVDLVFHSKPEKKEEEKKEEEKEIQKEEEKKMEVVPKEEKEEKEEEKEEKKEKMADDVKEDILSSMPQGSEKDHLANKIASKVIDNVRMNDGFVEMLGVIKQMNEAHEKLVEDFFVVQEMSKKYVTKIVDAEKTKAKLAAEIESFQGKK